MRRYKLGGPGLIPVNIVGQLHFEQRGGSMTATWGSKDVWDWDIDASLKWERDTLSHQYWQGMIRPTCPHHVDLKQCMSLVATGGQNQVQSRMTAGPRHRCREIATSQTLASASRPANLRFQLDRSGPFRAYAREHPLWAIWSYRHICQPLWPVGAIHPLLWRCRPPAFRQEK